MLKLKSKVGTRGQVVIPKPIREILKIHPKEELYFSIEDNKVIIEKINPEKFLEEFLGEVKDKRKEPKEVDWDKEYYSQFE